MKNGKMSKNRPKNVFFVEKIDFFRIVLKWLKIIGNRSKMVGESLRTSLRSAFCDSGAYQASCSTKIEFATNVAKCVKNCWICCCFKRNFEIFEIFHIFNNFFHFVTCPSHKEWEDVSSRCIILQSCAFLINISIFGEI